MEEIKFSVLMSVYAKELPQNLDAALKSVLVDQSLLPSELVLVKDGLLTPELEAVIEKYHALSDVLVQIVSLDTQVGLGKALNEGLKTCRYEWVARMDSDDISLPDRFQKQIRYLRQNPKVDLLGGWIDEYDESMQEKISTRIVPSGYDAIYKKSKYSNPFNHVSVMFRKTSVMEAGGYLPMEGMEDFYLWIRMLQNGCRGANIPQALVRVRSGKGMIQRRHGWRYFKNELRFAKTARAIGFWSLWDMVRNIAMRGLPRLLPLFLLERLYLLSRKGGG